MFSIYSAIKKLNPANLLVTACSLFSITMGLLVLTEWIHILVYNQKIMNSADLMKPNSALNFILLGCTVLLIAYPQPRIPDAIRRIFTYVVMLISGLSFIQSYTGITLGVDEIIYANSSLPLNVHKQMAMISAFEFFLLALGLACFDRKKNWHFLFTHTLTIIVLVISILTSIGYLYGAEAIHSIYLFRSITIQAAITFIILSIGILLITPKRGLVSIVTTSLIGGVMARRMLPFSIALPILLGWAYLNLWQNAMTIVEIRMAILVFIMIIIFSIFILLIARKMNYLDLERKYMLRNQYKTQKKLMDTRKMVLIGQLSAGIAHEINNPLGFVTSNISILEMQIKDLVSMFKLYEQMLASSLPANQIEQIEQMKQEKNIETVTNDFAQIFSETNEGLVRIKKIVANLGEFSQAEDIPWEMVDVNQCMDNAIDIIWNRLKYKIKLIKNYHHIPQISAFKNQLILAFIDILLNAAASIKDKGIIKIQTQVIHQTIYIDFTDNGAGLKSEEISKLFNLFMVSQKKNNALGLGIAYRIIQSHGGRIRAESKLGEGTTISIELPIP